MSKLLFILIILFIAKIGCCGTLEQIGAIKHVSYEAELAIYIDEASSTYGLQPELLTAILAKESMFNIEAVNLRTHDYGIGQLNIKTIRAYRFDLHRIQTDLRYSVFASAKVLSWFKKYGRHEAVWWCRYNVGTVKLINSNINSCAKYAAGVKLYQFSSLVAESN